MSEKEKKKERVGDLESGDLFTLMECHKRDGANLGTQFICVARDKNAKSWCLQLGEDGSVPKRVLISNITSVSGVRDFWEQPIHSTELSGVTLLDEPTTPDEELTMG